MSIEDVKSAIYIGTAVFSVLGSLIGFVWWLSAMWNAIKENRKLREDDKKEIMVHIDDMNKKLREVENENKIVITEIMKVLGEIKEQLATIKTKIEFYVNTNGKSR